MPSDVPDFFYFHLHMFFYLFDILISYSFQQAHQKNQLKDSIEVEEPEGITSFPFEVAVCSFFIYRIGYRDKPGCNLLCEYMLTIGAL